jgi:hypothetical protein
VTCLSKPKAGFVRSRNPQNGQDFCLWGRNESADYTYDSGGANYRNISRKESAMAQGVADRAGQRARIAANGRYAIPRNGA